MRACATLQGEGGSIATLAGVTGDLIIYNTLTGYCGADTSAEYDDASKAYKNLAWTLTKDGVLTISGAGAMKDYEYFSSPWSSYCSSVSSVVITDGIITDLIQDFEQNRSRMAT